MIIKKIRRKSPTRSAGNAEFTYLRHLSRYIVRADIDDLQELARLSDDRYLRDLARYAIADAREGAALATGGLNLKGATLPEWQAELAALLHRCPDAAGVIDHWIFSWPAGETPTLPEAERVIQIFMRCQGIERCKGVWGFHIDTDNPHLHLATMRIDPQSGARITAGDGWDIDAAHRAKAVIEAEYAHWKPEPGSRYLVRDGLLIEGSSSRVLGAAEDPTSWLRHRARSNSPAGIPKRDHPAIDPESLAYEAATGFMSRKRVAIEIAVPIVLQALTLDAAHAMLAKEGIELRRERSGAAFVIDGKLVKASIERRTSLAAIEKRFDQNFVPSPYKPVARDPRERWPDNSRRCAYYAARRVHGERLALAAQDIRTALGGGAKNQTVSAALKAAISSAAFPAFEAWQSGADVPDPASAIMGAMELSAVSIERNARLPTTNARARGFQGVQLGIRTIYRAEGLRDGPPAFVDIGHKVLVYAINDRAAVRASLLLIAARYPDNDIVVTGSLNFQRLVLEIANHEGVKLDGPLGRQQVRHVVGRSRSTPSRRSQKNHIEGAVPAFPKVERTRTIVEPRRRLSAMLSKLFHDQSWLVDDYRPSIKGREAAAVEPVRINGVAQAPPSDVPQISDERLVRAHRGSVIADAAAIASRSR